MQAIRTLLFITLATSLLVSCTSAPISPSQWVGPSDPTVEFPGTHMSGKAAVYRVVSGVDESGVEALDVNPIDVQSPLRQSVPVAGAIIQYPDGSTQSTAADGTFDASASTYAAINPESIDTNEVAVIVEPPSGSKLQAIGTTVFDPSPATEAQSESGTIPGDSAPPAQPGAKRVPQAYIWSCNGNDYSQGSRDKKFGLLPAIGPHFSVVYNDVREYLSAFATFSVHSWYYGHVYVCGTDQPDPNVEVVYTHWNKASDVQIGWTIRLRLLNTTRTAAVARDAVWAQPNNYFFSFNEHIELVCPYYYNIFNRQNAGCTP